VFEGMGVAAETGQLRPFHLDKAVDEVRLENPVLLEVGPVLRKRVESLPKVLGKPGKGRCVVAGR